MIDVVWCLVSILAGLLVAELMYIWTIFPNHMDQYGVRIMQLKIATVFSLFFVTLGVSTSTEINVLGFMWFILMAVFI